MKLKNTVSLVGMAQQMTVFTQAAAERYREVGGELIITSGSETTSRHSRTSLHYAGRGMDCRTRHLDLDDIGKAKLAKAISDDLGPDFDVIYENGAGGEHIHAEWQPKRRG